MDSYDYPRLAVVVVLLAVNLALIGAMSTSSAAYGPYNADWDGAETLRTAASESAEIELATTTERYGEIPAQESTAFVLAPDRPSDASVARVQSFVSRGGTLVVAGEAPNATNAYLDAVGASARIDGRQLRDDQNNYRSPELPVADNVTEHELTAGVESLTLNDGTTINASGEAGMGTSDVTTLVNSSDVAYVDADENESYDAGEPFGSLRVATVEPEGEGRIVVVSDPSVFTNAMLEQPGNRAFLDALVDGRSHVLVDYSQHASLPPLVYALLTVRASAPLQAVLAMLAFGAFALYVTRDQVAVALRSTFGWEREASDLGEIELDESAVKALLADRHPDWEESYAERVTEAIIRQRGGRGDDD
ncbi:DUF4350 domain-containing protein [Halosimplex salinum]|uniref:DUF4350 domain-containing protein n=1 Tax=Halosimplex salinum TaxID=1710538 RepID=UPI000F479F95|nr:DUF4350 domain-containing protein [Halosimplex salinum]